MRQNGRHFTDDIFKCIFLNVNIWILIKMTLNFVPKDSINNILSLVQIMAWCRPGDKPLSEPMMARLTTHICMARPQRVNIYTQGGLIIERVISIMKWIKFAIDTLNWSLINVNLQFSPIKTNFTSNLNYNFRNILREMEPWPNVKWPMKLFSEIPLLWCP